MAAAPQKQVVFPQRNDQSSFFLQDKDEKATSRSIWTCITRSEEITRKKTEKACCGAAEGVTVHIVHIHVNMSMSLCTVHSAHARTIWQMSM